MSRAARVVSRGDHELLGEAQRLSLQVTQRMEGTDWLQCTTPREVTHLVEAILTELKAMQALAGLGWVLALAPWAVWAGHTYLAPRADGKPG